MYVYYDQTGSTIQLQHKRLDNCRDDQVGSVCTVQYKAQEERYLTISTVS